MLSNQHKYLQGPSIKRGKKERGEDLGDGGVFWGAGVVVRGGAVWWGWGWVSLLSVQFFIWTPTKFLVQTSLTQSSLRFI